MPLDEIAKLEALGGSEINEAKKTLANAATAMLHGQDAANLAAETARKTFEEGTSGEGLPTISLTLPCGIIETIIAAGFAKSNGEARRAIQGGGIKLNDETVVDDKQQVTAPAKLSMGKKRHVLVTAG